MIGKKPKKKAIVAICCLVTGVAPVLCPIPAIAESISVQIINPPQVVCPGARRIAVADLYGATDLGRAAGQAVRTLLVTRMLIADRGLDTALKVPCVAPRTGTDIYEILRQGLVTARFQDRWRPDRPPDSLLAAEIARTFGIQMLVFGTCSAAVDRARGEETHVIYKARSSRLVEPYVTIGVDTRVCLDVTLTAVDLNTGRVLGSRATRLEADDEWYDDQGGQLVSVSRLIERCAAGMADSLADFLVPRFHVETFPLIAPLDSACSQEYDRLIQLAERHDLESACAVARDMTVACPTDPAALYNRAVLEEVAGRFDAAWWWCRRAVAMHDDSLMRAARDRMRVRALMTSQHIQER